MEERIKTALEFLKDGQSFSVGELKLDAEKQGTIRVTGWSQYVNFTSLTKEQCLNELGEIKILFYQMVDSSPELKNFINDKSKEFNLCFDDYGKGSILLCSEKGEILTWVTNLGR